MMPHTSPVKRLRPKTYAAFGIYFVLLAAYLALASGHFYSTDHVQVYQTTQSLAEDGDISIPAGSGGVLYKGEYYAAYEPGQPVLSLPLYAIGKLVAEHSSSGLWSYFSGDDIGQWGGTVQIFFVSLLNQFIAPLVAVIVFLICLQLGFSMRASFWTTMAYGLGTMAAVGAHEYFQHPLETLFLLAPIYVLLRHRDRLRVRDTLLAGVLLSLGEITRLNLAFVAPPMVAYIIWLRIRAIGLAGGSGGELKHWFEQLRSYAGHYRSEWRYFVAFAAPHVAAVAFIMVLNALRTGDMLAMHNVSTGTFSVSHWPEAIYGYLLSPGRSFFLYSPPAVAGVLLFRRFMRAFAPEAALFIAIAAIYLLLYCSFLYWHGAGCWGPRYLEPLVPLAVIPAAYVFESRWHTRVFAVLAALGVLIALLGTVVNPVYAEQWRGLWGGGVAQPFQDNAYFYVPRISPVVIHFGDFFHGRNWDLWLQYVLHTQGWLPFLATLLMPIAILTGGLRLLRQAGLVSFAVPGWFNAFLRQQRESLGADQ